MRWNERLPGAVYRLSRVVRAVIPLSLLSACGFFSREYSVVGRIADIDATDPRAEGPKVPSEVTSGVPFSIMLWTTGDGCTHAGYTEKSVDGNEAVVTPYDVIRIPWGGTCTDIARLLEHRAELVFEEPGTARITVRYSTGDGGDQRADRRKVYTLEVSPPGQ